MHLIYELAEGNARTRVAEKLYHVRYPQRDAIDRWMFANLQPNCVDMDHYEVIHIVRRGGARYRIHFVPCLEQTVLGIVRRKPYTLLGVEFNAT
ncbi:hypothetical protein TNCV_1674791 [Trichonephila clavipes]|nr:hypothetical protein TNCV_1674791 [Trichonephila clavipes]